MNTAIRYGHGRTHTGALGHRQAGMSLVELLVAMTIGLFLMGAVGAIYVSTVNSTRGSTIESQMNEDASLALEMLQQQIRLAGYSGFAADGKRNFPGIGVRGCDGGFTDNSGTTDFDALACAADPNGPDALAIRYEATMLNGQTAAGNPANCSHEGIFPWWPTAAGANIPLADNRYFIANDAANDNTPTLYCKGRGGNAGGFSDAAALIPNIENLQVRYAITRTPVDDEILPHQITAYVDANDATLGANLPNWSRVAGVRICLLARTSQPVPSGGASRADLGRFVDCDGVEQVVQDGFLRRAYHTTIHLRNMRPGLPADFALEADGSIRNPWAYQTEAN